VKVLTGNALLTGAVIYRAWTGGWTHDLALAERFDEADGEAALAAAEAKPGEIVGPYLVSIGDAGPDGRDRNKERIRAKGPTVGNSLVPH
jgi:hypothetical protein